MHGAHQTEVPLVYDFLGQTAQGLLHVSILVQAIVPVKTVLVEAGQVVCPSAEGSCRLRNDMGTLDKVFYGTVLLTERVIKRKSFCGE